MQPGGIAGLVLAAAPASAPQWIAEINRLRAELPLDLQATLRKHEEAGTTDDPAYEEAMMAFMYRRHLWPPRSLAGEFELPVGNILFTPRRPAPCRASPHSSAGPDGRQSGPAAPHRARVARPKRAESCQFPFGSAPRPVNSSGRWRPPVIVGPPVDLPPFPFGPKRRPLP